MKLLDSAHYEDWGHEWYFQVLSFYPNFALIDCAIQWDDFESTETFPSLFFGLGPHHLFGFSFRWKRFEIRCDFF